MVWRGSSRVQHPGQTKTLLPPNCFSYHLPPIGSETSWLSSICPIPSLHFSPSPLPDLPTHSMYLTNLSTKTHKQPHTDTPTHKHTDTQTHKRKKEREREREREMGGVRVLRRVCLDDFEVGIYLTNKVLENVGKLGRNLHIVRSASEGPARWYGGIDALSKEGDERVVTAEAGGEGSTGRRAANEIVAGNACGITSRRSVSGSVACHDHHGLGPGQARSGVGQRASTHSLPCTVLGRHRESL